VNLGFRANKLLVVPVGVDAQQFKPTARHDEKFRVIYCGSLTLRKGVHYLLEAFHELNLADAELWLIGTPSGEIAPYLKRYGGPHVVVKGAFPQGQLRQQYSQGSVLCAPSIEDGFGMVVSQAMACGLPVICTKNTGAQDLVRESVDGFAVPIRDVDALKERLHFLYSHQAVARQMGEAARQRILGGFTWDHYGERIVSEYSRVIGETVRSPGRATPSHHANGTSANIFAAAIS
jgi:glycosyltransferase involved in cell wall biosynthesis